MTVAGPDWTLCGVQVLADGRRRVLVRKRGGRLVRVTVAAVAANGDDIHALVGRVLSDWPHNPYRQPKG